MAPRASSSVQELGQGRQRDARLAVDRGPERRRGHGRLLLHQQGHAARRGRLHGVQEGADALDVIAHVGHEGDIARGSCVHRPAGRQLPHVGDAVLGGDLGERRGHARRRLDGHDLAHVAGERQGVAAGARADVQPDVGRPGEASSTLATSSSVRSGSARKIEAGRGVEVGPVGHLAEAVHLLAVGPHAPGPGELGQVGRADRCPGWRRPAGPPAPARGGPPARRQGPDRPSGRARPATGWPAAAPGCGRDRVRSAGRWPGSRRWRSGSPRSPRDAARAGRRGRSAPRPAATSLPSPAAARPTCRDEARPRVGSGLRTRRSVRHCRAVSTAAASSPSTTTTFTRPAAASVSRTCCRTGRPSRGARSLPPPNRLPAPAARTTPVIAALPRVNGCHGRVPPRSSPGWRPWPDPRPPRGSTSWPPRCASRPRPATSCRRARWCRPPGPRR